MSTVLSPHSLPSHMLAHAGICITCMKVVLTPGVLVQNIQSNSVVGAPQAYLVCPNDQYDPTKTCQDFGDTLALSDNGKIMIVSGGFKQEQMDRREQQQAAYQSYVYQTANCVSDVTALGA